MHAWKLSIVVLGAILAAAPAEAAAKPAAADTLLVHCGTLIDGIADLPRADVDVRIEAGRISAVGQGLATPPGGARLDLGDYTCLPGLIDMHTHLLDQFYKHPDLRGFVSRTLEDALATGAAMAGETLQAGFTTVRDVGTYDGRAERELRDRIDRGEVAGPRLQFAGFYLTVPGGGGDLVIPGIPEEDIPAHLRLGVARGPDAFRDKARLAIEGGAGVIKVIASGAVLAYGGVPGAPEMTREEIAAVVAVAHAAGIPVTAHAHGAQSIRDAILAGADSIEHASLLDEEGIRLALRHDIALSMDIYNGDWIAVEGRRRNWPEEFLRKNDETTLIQRQNFRRAHEAGVTIVFGTDAGVYPHGLNARQFAYMVEWGMTPMEAIRAATSVAARVLGWADRVGALRPGRFGDLVAVAGDPLDDMRVLEHVAAVVKGGIVIKAPGSSPATGAGGN